MANTLRKALIAEAIEAIGDNLPSRASMLINQAFPVLIGKTNVDDANDALNAIEIANVHIELRKQGRGLMWWSENALTDPVSHKNVARALWLVFLHYCDAALNDDILPPEILAEFD